MPDMSGAVFDKPFVRFGLAVASVAASFLIRTGIDHYLGVELPTFITFYPAIMVAAVVGGFGPGLHLGGSGSLRAITHLAGSAKFQLRQRVHRRVSRPAPVPL